MNYKDCIIVTKDDVAMTFRSTRVTVENHGQFICVYDNDDIMCIYAMSEIKAVIIVDCGDVQIVQNMIDAITNKHVIK